MKYDSVGVVMDSLVYQYEKINGKMQRNRLYHVNELNSSTSMSYDLEDQGNFTAALDSINRVNNYHYDEIGNLVRDSIEGIDTIRWTVYGKIKAIKRFSGNPKDNLYFDYDASGNRVAKHVYTSADVWKHSTYYVRDAQGNVMSTYQHKPVGMDMSFKLQEQHLYGSSRLGLAKPDLEMIGAMDTLDTLKTYLGYKNYEFSNHLGNVLSVLSDKKIQVEDTVTPTQTGHYVADLLSSTDYYPFGQSMPGRNYSSSTYRYGFNGKEKDNETYGDANAYDFGARIYDPRLGKTFSPDAHSNKYPFISPYSFALDNPISVNDPDGNDVYLVIWATADGEIGHAAIAVSNYRKVETKVIENGKEVTKTSYVPDGTFTYYDLWPGGSGAGKGNADKDISADYQKFDKVTWNGIFNEDPSGSEGRNPEGIVKLKTTYEQDQNVIKLLDARKTANKDYNGYTNNCSDNAECGIEAATGKDINADEYINGKPGTTPNKLFRVTRGLPNASVLRDPGGKVDNDFIEGATGGIGGKILGAILKGPQESQKNERAGEVETPKP